MANNNGAAEGQDRLLEVFHEVDHIHQHALDHDCCCEELTNLISDVWAHLVDWNWNKIPRVDSEGAGEA